MSNRCVLFYARKLGSGIEKESLLFDYRHKKSGIREVQERIYFTTRLTIFPGT